MNQTTSFFKLLAKVSTVLLACVYVSNANAELSVGAAIVDITPEQLPVLVNGSMTARSASEVKTRVNARAIVIADGEERIALVVVDSCMVPQVLLDDAKQRVENRVGIAKDHIMISATHTHTAPSAFSALGTPADPVYVPFLRERLVEVIAIAASNVQPARVGWGSGSAPDFTALRRWIRRPDRIENDPFGNPTVRANMHAAKNPDNVTGPSGPEDPELSMLAFESTEGKPIAVLANFSMHYFQDQPISADYFGLFCDVMQRRIAGDDANDVVVAMSHGCSGDIWRRDYAAENFSSDQTINEYANGLADVAFAAFQSIKYVNDSDIEMSESRLPMRYRVPDIQRLAWSQSIVDRLGDELPKTREEVYAREQVLLHELQETKVVVQAMRIGHFGIVTTPNETYALTGLKLKLQSPIKHTMVIELANGADGYIPPPEQHHLGGYNTWAARSAGLEVNAEPRIVAEGLRLLERVSGAARKTYEESPGALAAAVLKHKPIAYWRLNEMQGTIAADATGNERHAAYEPGVVFFLEGPEPGFTILGQQNRCAHFAGGRLKFYSRSLPEEYTVALSFWNGFPINARETTGWLFSRDFDHGTSSLGEHLGISGSANRPGHIVFQQGNGSQPAIGRSSVQRWKWCRIVLVRSANRVRVYLNGDREPEIDIECERSSSVVPEFFVGGRSDNDSNFEGRIDEVALYDYAMTPESVLEIQ